MFHCSKPLGKRVELRLRGFKAPSLRTLHKAIAGVDRAALRKQWCVPHVEPPSGLSSSDAWDCLSIPLAFIIRSHAEQRRKRSSKWLSLVGEGNKKGRLLVSQISSYIHSIRYHNPSKHFGTTWKVHTVPVLSSSLQMASYSLLDFQRKFSTQQRNTPRYKPPATSYWTHSIYSYNKNRLRMLPAATSTMKHFANVYFNVVPAGFEDVLPENHKTKRRSGCNLFKVFVSGSTPQNQLIRQDLLGKISHPRRSFMEPYRQLIRLQPRIVFKHYVQLVNVSIFIHDKRIAYLKRKLAKLTKELQCCAVPGF